MDEFYSKQHLTDEQWKALDWQQSDSVLAMRIGKSRRRINDMRRKFGQPQVIETRFGRAYGRVINFKGKATA